MAKRNGFKLNGNVIAPGTRQTVELPVSLLSDHTPVNLSVHAVHGRRKGPTVFVSAAVHGDEVMGVEICRRLLQSPLLDKLRGTLMVVPIVNSFGFQNRSRYLPDRRDLNRSFPGYARGSLASRLAEIFLDTVVKRCDLGIDLHSAAVHRTNLPQVRINRGNERMVAMAEAFGAPVVLTSSLRDGSLRAEAKRAGIDVLLYEAGEGLRFDEMATRAGVAGILRVLRAMDNPRFNILGHPTGRLINEREAYKIDLEAVIEAAAERGCCLELNAQPSRLDLAGRYAGLLREAGVLGAVSTDAHATGHLGFMHLGVAQARRGWMEKKHLINTRTLKQLQKILAR